MSRPIIEVNNLSKCYKLGSIGATRLRDDAERLWKRMIGKAPKADTQEFWALRDVSFEVQPGEVVGIIGRNGAGKSTLLKILSRITDPSSGGITLRGRVASLLEVGTGFHPDLTGRENVYLNGAILGMTKAEIRSKFDEIVAFAEIDKFIDTPVKRYSSGMYVRLAFAVAAHLEPEILIVDEVLAVGDQQFQNKCLGKMQDVSRHGRTVLFVSHNMGAIGALTTKALYLKAGQFGLFSPTKSVLQTYLNDGCSSSSEWRFERPSKHPMQIMRVALRTEDGALCSEFEAERPFVIELDYEIRSRISGAILEAYIFTADGIHLVTLGDRDHSSVGVQIRNPGRYRAQVTFQSKLLNTGTYLLKVNAGLRSTETYECIDVLRFSVHDSTHAESRQNRAGLIIPGWPWHTIAL